MPLYVSSRLALLNPPAVAAAPALGTPTFVAAASNSSGGLTNAVSVPTGTQDGDVMLALYTMGNNTSTITDPAGWTEVVNYDVGPGRLLRALYRVASSEGASHTWQINPSITTSIVICTYRGCLTSSPIDGTPTTNTVTSTTATALGITTTNNNTMLVMACYAGGTRNYTASSLGNERADLGGSGALSLGVFDGLQVTAGASGNTTATVSSSATVGSILLGIKPSGGV